VEHMKTKGIKMNNLLTNINISQQILNKINQYYE